MYRTANGNLHQVSEHWILVRDISSLCVGEEALDDSVSETALLHE